MSAPAEPATSTWLNSFEAFGAVHAVSVVVCAAVTVGLIALGVRLKRTSPRAERRLRIGWIAMLIGVQGYTQLWWLLPSNFDPGVSLPVHFCDVAPWFAPFALLLRVRFAQTMLYFWGLALSSWAFVTPVLGVGAASTAFWLFWIGHTQIVASAFYLVFVDRYRPGRRDFVVVCLTTAVYSTIMLFTVNIPFSADYTYLTPERSPASAVGPWPWRAPVVIIGEWMLFAALWLPFQIRRSPARGSEPASDPGSESGTGAS